MKHIIEFDPIEDKDALTAAIYGMDFFFVIWELDQKLRQYLKYGHKFEDADEALERLREELHEILEAKNLNIDMIS